MTGSVFPDHVVALFGKNTPIASVPKFVSATKAQGDRNWQVPAQTDLPTEAPNGVSWSRAARSGTPHRGTLLPVAAATENVRLGRHRPFLGPCNPLSPMSGHTARVEHRPVKLHQVINNRRMRMKIHSSRWNQRGSLDPIKQSKANLPIIVTRPIGEAVQHGKGGVKIQRQLARGCIIVDADLSGMDSMPLQAFVHDFGEYERSLKCETRRRTQIRLGPAHHAPGTTQDSLDKSPGQLLCCVKHSEFAARRIETTRRRIPRRWTEKYRPIGLPMDPENFSVDVKIERQQAV